MTTLTPTYIKHLIQCRCVLKLYEEMKNPPQHKFIVFSEIKLRPIEGSWVPTTQEEWDECLVGKMVPSFAACPNCGLIHHITEVGTSTITGKSDMKSLPTIEDLEMAGIPEKVMNQLKSHECELHIWQEVAHIFDKKLWGSYVILSRESLDAKENARNNPFFRKETGKILVFHSETIFKIETFETDGD